MPSPSQTPTRSDVVQIPLAVDLDGTLIRSDSLVESLLRLLKVQPLMLIRCVGWLFQGKACFKERVAALGSLDAARLPYHDPLLELLRQEHRRGRPLILATGSAKSLAQSVAGHLGLFNEVIATESGINRTGSRKRDALVERFGTGGFDYAGNSIVDLPVWKEARAAWVVNAHPSVARRAHLQGRVDVELPRPRTTFVLWRRALRIHQWSKNGLLFAPMLASHRLLEPELWMRGLLAFVIFSLCASAVYLVNDLMDLADDRDHPGKKSRPIASGDLDPLRAATAALLLPVPALALSLTLLPMPFSLTLGLYLAGTMAYSSHLKRVVGLDILVLTGFYLLRIVAGGFALGITPSHWLTGFAAALFLNLVLLKRFTELVRIQVPQAPLPGRGYTQRHIPWIRILALCSGLAAVLVMALYAHSPSAAGLHDHPHRLWVTVGLLATWLGRLWWKAGQGRMDDDPVAFTLKDRISLAMGLAIALDIAWAA